MREETDKVSLSAADKDTVMIDDRTQTVTSCRVAVISLFVEFVMRICLYSLEIKR